MTTIELIISVGVIGILIFAASALTKDEDMSDDPRDMDNKFFP